MYRAQGDCYVMYHCIAGLTRVDGNRKGILTRERQPKMAAHIVRRRYHNLINQTATNSLLQVNTLHDAGQKRKPLMRTIYRQALTMHH